MTFDEESNDELLEVDVIDNAIPYVDKNLITQEPFKFDLGGDSDGDAAKSNDKAEKASLENKEVCSQLGEKLSDDQIGEEPSECPISWP